MSSARGPGERRSEARRTLLVTFAVASASACSATDVVAVAPRGHACDAGACPDAGPMPDAAVGCSAGACAPAADRGTFCAGSGTLVRAGDVCLDEASGPAFGFAVCSCSDIISGGVLTVDAFRGTSVTPAIGAADVGVNRDLMLNGSGSVDGEVLVFGQSMVSMDVNATVRSVGAAPCACDEASLLDVPGVVAAYRLDNDNAAVGFREDALDGFSGEKSLALDCGRYFLTRLKGDALDLTIQGNAAIFIETNIELSSALRVHTSGSDAQVSLFVAGEVNIGGALALGGDPNANSRVHLYLASRGTLELRGGAELIGNLYAPRAELITSGTFEQYGALFVDRINTSSAMHVHYDVDAASPARCEP